MKNLFLGAFFAFCAITAYSQTIDPVTFSTNGTVDVVKRDGNTLFIGGSFSEVGFRAGGQTLLPIGEERPIVDFPVANSTVNYSIPDGAGGWYVAGSFSQQNGINQQRVSHILANNSIDGNFAVTVNTTVNALFLDGNDLYIGGSFTTFNGVTVQRLVRVNKTTGVLDLDWSPAISNGVVNSVIVNGDDVYAAGSFSEIAGFGQTQHFAILSKTTGLAEPGFSVNSTVVDMLLDNGNLYLSGSFNAGIISKSYLTAYSGTSSFPSFDFPESNSTINKIIPDGSGGWYIGGSFSVLGGLSAARVAHINADQSVDTDFQASLNSTVETLFLDGNDLYIGGSFTTANGNPANRLIRVNKNTGALDATWLPDPNSTVISIYCDATRVYAGGSFTTVAGIPNIERFSVISKITGQPEFTPTINSTVRVIEGDTDEIYLGGSFTQSGYTQQHLTFLTPTNDIPTQFSPAFNSNVEVIIEDGSGGWYVGGSFTQIGTLSRQRIAHILSDYSVDPNFVVNVNSTVQALHLDGTNLYMGGSFTQVNNVAINRLARINTTNATLDQAFSVNPNSTIQAITTTANEVLVGGSFSQIGGQTIDRYATLNKSTGAVIQARSANNTVNTFEKDESAIYAAGSFTEFYYAHDYISSFPAGSSVPVLGYPETNSPINSAILDGTGGYYVGGSFTTVGGVTRNRIAHILADGSIDPNFDANINSTVDAIFKSGNDLYIGGSFTSVSGNAVTRIARINATTGAFDGTFAVTGINSTVNSIFVDNNVVYIGGSFSTVAGSERLRLAAITTAGALSTWNPAPNSTVNNISGINGSIFVSGSFTQIGGAVSSRIAALSPTTGNQTAFAPGAINSTVEDFIINGTDLYIAGSFTNVAGSLRNGFASLNAATGALNPFTINVPGTILDLNISGNTLLISGNFSTVDGETRERFAEFDLTTSALTTRAPNFNSTVSRSIVLGTNLLLFGSYTQLSRIPASRLAKIDPITLVPSAIGSLSVNSTVTDIIAQGENLMISGFFNSVNSMSRNGLASINKNTGVLNALNISTNGFINTLSIFDNTLYVGGSFSTVDGQARRNAAAYDLSNSSLTAWAPDLNSTVNALSIDAGNVLIGGAFTFVKTRDHNYLAKFNPTSLSFENVGSGINSTIHDIVKEGNTLYVAGSFSTALGQSRLRFASINLTDNTILPATITANSTIYTILKRNNDFFVGGEFTELNGVPRGRAGWYDATTGALTEWNPSFNSAVNTIEETADGVLVGGSYSNVSSINRNFVLSMDVATRTINPFNITGLNSTVFAMDVTGNDLIIAGSFSAIQGISGQRLASVDKITGAVNALNVGTINSTVQAVNEIDGTLYFGGNFTEVGGQSRGYLAAVTYPAGVLSEFNPKFNNTVDYISNDESNMLVTGSFDRLASENRTQFAAIDLSTNQILPVGGGLSINSTVRDLDFDESNVYIVGSFTQVGGQTRNRVAAFSRTDGALTSFNPNVNGTVHCLDLEGGVAYFGGSFTTVLGQNRTNIAGVNTASSAISSLDRVPNSTVLDVIASGNTLYLGGSFTDISGQGRQRIATLDIAGNQVTAFNPGSNSTVRTLELDGSLLYVGGDFTIIASTPRNRIAALSITDGSANDFNPGFNSGVVDIEIEENYLFAAGSFTNGAGQDLSRLTLLDKNTGSVLLSFAPAINTTVNAINYSDGKLHAGGSFNNIGQNLSHPSLVRFNMPPPGTATFAVALVSNTSVNGFDIGCNGQATGSITLTANGGQAPYTYNLSAPNATRSGSIPTTSATETALPAGNYIATVTDALDAVATGNITLTQPALAFTTVLTLSAPITSVGGNQGAIQVDPNGGTPPYSYSYIVGGGAPLTGNVPTGTPIVISGLSAGTYAFSLTDASGCMANPNFNLPDYVLVNLVFNVFDQITCNGDLDGRIRVQAFNGVTPYSYVLDASDDTFDQTGTMFFSGQQVIESDLGPDTYNVTLTDGVGNVYTAGPITLVNPPVLNLATNINNQPSFAGATNGSIGLVASGGSAPYTYNYTKNGVLTAFGSFIGSAATINNLGAGDYVFTMTDANSCQVISETITLAEGNDPCAALGGDADGDNICDDNDPCPLLANLSNGQNCGINGTVVNCECVESCALTFGTPVVTCSANTAGNDTYTVSIFYSGMAPGATLTAGNTPGCMNPNILISGSDPATQSSGTIILTANEADACWSLNLTSSLCSLTLSGPAPSCNPLPCPIVFGAPVVSCLATTDGDDDYTVSIPYSGISASAVLSAGSSDGCTNAGIVISGSNPATSVGGTIILTASEAISCWSLTLISDLCNLSLSGEAPDCNPAVDCPSLGLDNGDPCEVGGTVVNCQCVFPDCNGNLGGSVVDTDGDGVCDDADNCVGISNADQADLDGDNIGNACDPDIDGDGVANADDCDPMDAGIGAAAVWYVDNDGDGFGTNDATLLQCEQPDGYAAVAGDCNDNNADINPNAQSLDFTGNGNFANSLISPLTGSPSTTFQFAVVYTDATGALPPIGYPRVLLDYEANGIFNNPNDRAVLLTPADVNDVNTVDGKTYIGSINALVSGTNYQVRVQALANGCLTEIGPFNAPDVLTEPDLEIFANDITFSNINPAISSELTVTATFRNVSDLPAQNFNVRLSSQYDPSEVYPVINVANVNPGATASVSWTITTPDVPAWVPMQVFVDSDNDILETNELDNNAVRPYINGDYTVPGVISPSATVSPSVQFASPSASVNISGFAIYEDTALPLTNPSVAGASVGLNVSQTGAGYTGTTNSQGFFSISIPAPTTPGVYTVTGEITDFTLTGYFSVTFTILEPQCLPDLSTNVLLSASQIFIGESIDGSITVTNIGCSDVLIPTLLDVSQTGGIPGLADQTVPPLAVGESFTFNFAGITFNQAGTYNICGLADAEFLVVEQSESNNYRCKSVTVVPPLPDIVPLGGPVGSAFLCNNPANPTFSIANIGYVSTGAFDYEIDVTANGVFEFTHTGTIVNLNPGQSQSVTVPYVYPAIGVYTFQVRADVPLPNGQVVEISETNNVSNRTFNVIPCKPDLVVLGCGQLEVDPADLEIPGTATYTAQVRNSGNAPAIAPIQFDFVVSTGELYTFSYANNIAPNETVEFSTEAPALASGTATLTAIVDPLNIIDEFSEFNNQRTDSLCWDFVVAPKCGGNFWTATYSPNQIVNLSVGLSNRFLYKATNAKVRFEVSGPGIAGTALLGDAIVPEVNQTCGCPYVATLPTTFLLNEVGTYTFTMTADPDGEYDECREDNNVLVREVLVTNLADMRVLSQFINPSLLNPELGESIFFDITYENIGVSNPAATMDLAVLVDDIPFSLVQDVPGLVNGQNNTIAIPMPYASNIAGAHIVRAIIDSNNEIAENNELNNEATRAVVVGSAANLFFEVFIPINSTPQIGENITIDALIGNNGELDVTADVLFKYINDSGVEIQIGSLPVSVIVGGSQAISLPWIVLDNSTTLLGEIVNASELEFNYDDNFASATLNNFAVAISVEPFCASENQGSLMADASGGATPYTYSWSTGFVGQTLMAAPGTYTVTVTDSNGAEATTTATITQNPACIPQVCSLSAVSFNVSPTCNQATGLYAASLVLAYANPPAEGMIQVNGQDFPITVSPQTFTFQLSSGAVNFTASFTATTDCALTIITGIVLEACEQDCAGNFGGSATVDLCGVCDANSANDNTTCLDCEGVPNGDAVPGSPCMNASGAMGIYNSECGCDVDAAPCNLVLVGIEELTDACFDFQPEIIASLNVENPNGETELTVFIDYDFNMDDEDETLVFMIDPLATELSIPLTLAAYGLAADITFSLGTGDTGCSVSAIEAGFPIPICVFTTISTLELECGGLVLQVTNALPGLNPGGTATSETRTIYSFGPDNGNGIPTYTGGSWAYVYWLGDTILVNSGITADVTVNADGVVLINGWPAYQFINDTDGSTANGPLGPWNYFLIDGTRSQNACEEIPGCTSDAACNYNPEASIDDDSCVFATGACESCLDGGVVNNDADGDGVCDADEVTGCTDESACNFNSDATDSDGSCVFATGPCEVCNDNGGVDNNDADGDGVCDPDEVPGCTNMMACNYNPEATDDNDTCILNGIICSLEDGSTGTLVDCECTPVIVGECVDYGYYLADILADGTTTIYDIDLGTGALTVLAISDIEVHIAFNEVDKLIYAVSKADGSYRTLDPFTAVWGPNTLIGASVQQIVGAAINADGKLLISSQSANTIYEVNLGDQTVGVFDSYSPTLGGDIAFGDDGALYHATREAGGALLLTIPQEVGADILLGSVPALVTGLANTEGGQLIISSVNASSLAVRNYNGSMDAAIALTLDGAPFTTFNGDLASGCASNIPVIDECNYKLYYTNNPVGSAQFSLMEVSLNDDATTTNNTLMMNIGESHIALSPDGATIYIVGGASNLRVYDVASNSIVNTIPILTDGGQPLTNLTAAVSGADGTVYAAGGSKVWSINPGTGVATQFGPNIPVFGGDLVFAPTGEDDAMELWLINRATNRLTNVLTGAFIVLPADEINGAAILENGNLLVSNGDGNGLFIEISLSDASVVGMYETGLALNNGDLAGGCTTTSILEGLVIATLPADEATSTLTSYPNPTNGPSQVVFATGATGRTILEVYDMNGRNVATLFNQDAQAGKEYRVDFDGVALPNGVYIYRLTSVNEIIIDKFMIAK